MGDERTGEPVGARAGIRAFLIADVRGYTLFTQERGDEAAAKLAARFAAISREAVDDHGGSVIELRGDEALAVFDSARQAIRAATLLQQRFLEETEADPTLPLPVGIGLDAGEAVPLERGYRGGALNLAARLCGRAGPGEILASQGVVNLARKVDGVRLVDRGELHLKGLEDPVRVFRVISEEGDPAERIRRLAPARPARGPAPLRLARRHPAAAAVVALALAAIVAVPATIALRGGGQPLSQVDANALGLIDSATGKISGQVAVGATPSHIALGDGAIWVTNADADTVSRIDPLKGIVVQTISVGSSPSGIATGNGAVWVANSLDGTVSRIDPATNTVVQTITVGNGPVGIVYEAGSVWAANTGDDTITRIDAASGTPTKTLPIAATELAFGDGTLWASDQSANQVERIDPRTGDVEQTIHVGNGPAGLALGSGTVWVANSLDGTVSRIDATTNSIAATIPVGNGPTAVAVDASGVWVSNAFDGSLVRIDPRTNQAAPRISVGNRPQGVAIMGGEVLVTVRQSDAGHRGGTLTMRMNRDLDSIDTALAYDSTSWTVLRMTGDGLVAFNQASGLAGTQLVPDLAVSLPTPTDGGRTYTFQLRQDILYSNGRPIKASDFRSTFERDFEVGTPVPEYYDGIVGAARCQKGPKPCDLSRGIVADDRAGTVTFHLVAPDPEFLDKLALPFAYVVPAGTPPRDVGTQPLPATGPYMIASYVPKHVLRLVRNPRFHEWSKAAQPDGYPDQIVVEIGGTPDEAVNEVIGGKADAFSTSQSETPPSESLLARIKTQYASQVHVNPQETTVALFLNTRLPPFNHPDVRRALNYAADRAAAVEAVGGPGVARVTCQILPPHFPGYSPYCPYTAGNPAGGVWTAPDLARARALIARSGTRGMKVTVWSWADLGGIGPYTVKLLRSLGYRASMKVRGGYGYFGVVGDSRTRAQIGTTEWISDYPAASGFFIPILTCTSFLPNNPGNSNDAEFCDPHIDRQIEHALTEQATNPDAARGLWEGVDRQTVDQAPWVPLVNPEAVDVVSKRVGNYQYSPPLGMLIDQLWVR